MSMHFLACVSHPEIELLIWCSLTSEITTETSSHVQETTFIIIRTSITIVWTEVVTIDPEVIFLYQLLLDS